MFQVKHSELLISISKACSPQQGTPGRLCQCDLPRHRFNMLWLVANYRFSSTTDKTHHNIVINYRKRKLNNSPVQLCGQDIG